KASSASAITSKNASLVEITPESSISALTGVLITLLNTRSFLCSFTLRSDGCFLERTMLNMAKKPKKTRILAPTIWAESGDMIELSMVPIVMDPSTTNPEIVMMMASAENGTRILLTPYVIPTPNPSKLTAITKNNKPVKYSTPTKSFVFTLKLLYGI